MASPVERIENIIDEIDIDVFLNATQQICFYKAEHLRENWQDETSAKYWEKIGKKLDAVIKHT